MARSSPRLPYLFKVLTSTLPTVSSAGFNRLAPVSPTLPAFAGHLPPKSEAIDGSPHERSFALQRMQPSRPLSSASRR
jgi:hypothetical protein